MTNLVFANCIYVSKTPLTRAAELGTILEPRPKDSFSVKNGSTAIFSALAISIVQPAISAVSALAKTVLFQIF